MGHIPDWATFLGSGAFEAYRDAVERAVHAQGLEMVFDWEAGQAHVDKGWSLGLVNLAQRWHGTPEVDREDLLAAFLAKVATFEPDVVLEPASRDDLLGRLRIRLYAYDEALPGEVWREYAGIFREAVVLDSPQFIASAIEDVLKKYDVTIDEAFERATANVRALGMPEVLAEELEEGVQFRVVVGPDDTSSAWLPWVSELVGPLPEHGILVAAPTQHGLFVLSYPADRSVDALQWLAAVSWKAYQDGPSSLSPSLLFIHPDRLDAIYVFQDEVGELTISPPASAMPWFAS